MNSFAWDKKKKQKNTRWTLLTAPHCGLMTPVKLIRSFSVHDYIWTGMHMRGCQCEKRGMSLSPSRGRVRKQMIFFQEQDASWRSVWLRGAQRLLLVTGAALLGVSALRYWVVWVDGWDRPCELPLSLTLEDNKSDELKSGTQTHLITQDIYVWKIYTIYCLESESWMTSISSFWGELYHIFVRYRGWLFIWTSRQFHLFDSKRAMLTQTVFCFGKYRRTILLN